MIKITVSIRNEDARSYDKDIEEVSVLVPSIIQAAPILQAINTSIRAYIKVNPLPAPVYDELMNAIENELTLDEQQELRQWLGVNIEENAE